MPAQSGSSTVLERMHRGYSREAYLSLIERARQIVGSSNNVRDPLMNRGQSVVEGTKKLYWLPTYVLIMYYSPF